MVSFWGGFLVGSRNGEERGAGEGRGKSEVGGQGLTLAGYLNLVADAHGLAVVRLLAHAVAEALVAKVLEVGHVEGAWVVRGGVDGSWSD